MTKKETAEMDSLRDQLLIARALRFTEEVNPDVMPPDYNSRHDALSTGFSFIAYAGFGGDSTAVGCSSSSYHARGRTDKTTSQGATMLYSTRLLALRGLRHEVEKEVAKRLAAIDKQIERELANL